MNPIKDSVQGVVQGVAAPLFGLIDDLFTSDDERAAAKLKLMDLEQKGELDRMKVQLSAILAEANSRDPWTSRARPTFLYVVYVFILSAIPFGFLFAVNPDIAGAVTTGAKAWLEAIPQDMWWLFGAGYLGYTGARSVDKWRAST